MRRFGNFLITTNDPEYGEVPLRPRAVRGENPGPSLITAAFVSELNVKCRDKRRGESLTPGGSGAVVLNVWVHNHSLCTVNAQTETSFCFFGLNKIHKVQGL